MDAPETVDPTKLVEILRHNFPRKYAIDGDFTESERVIQMVEKLLGLK